MPGPFDFGPAYPMSEYDMPQAPMAPMPTAGFSQIAPPGSMPMDQQQMLIAEIKRMSLSQNPKEREAAKRFMDEWGRSMIAVGLNRATRPPFQSQMGMPPDQGVSDALMMMGQDKPNNYYSAANIDFSKRLTQAMRPAAYETAEAIGDAANLGLGILGLKRAIGRPAGGPPGRPPPRSPGVPLIPPDLPSPLSPSPSVSPPPPGGPRAPQGPPQWPQFLERWRRGEPEPQGPPPTDTPTGGELNVGDFLDRGTPVPRSRFQNRGPDGRYQKGFQPERPDEWDPFHPLWRRRND